MILDSTAQLHRYNGIHPLFSYVAEFIETHTLSTFEKSKTEIGRGVRLIIDEYTTKPAEEKKAEYHRKYIDMQIILSGCERCGYAELSRCAEKIPYDSEKEAGYVTAILEFFTLYEGSFAIFFPNDVHMPGVRMERDVAGVKKAVFKIPVIG
jgi:YhcH/YjgK/YiaL family protein